MCVIGGTGKFMLIRYCPPPELSIFRVRTWVLEWFRWLPMGAKWGLATARTKDHHRFVNLRHINRLSLSPRYVQAVEILVKSWPDLHASTPARVRVSKEMCPESIFSGTTSGTIKSTEAGTRNKSNQILQPLFYPCAGAITNWDEMFQRPARWCAGGMFDV